MKLILLVLLLASQGLLTACTSKLEEGIEAGKIEVQEKMGCVGAACAVCELPWGGELPSGESIESVFSKELVACGGNCDDHKARLTCREGKLEALDIKSGAALDVETAKFYNACYARKCNCSHGGVTVLDGDEREFFRSAEVSCPSKCTSKRVLVCKDGKMVDKLTPTSASLPNQYRAASCRELPCANCTLSTGDVVPHGGSKPAYSKPDVTCDQDCNWYKSSITCNNGVLSSNSTIYKHTTCARPVNCTKCVLPCGRQVLPGASDYCFKASKPADCGLSCLDDRRLFKCSATSQLQNEDGTPVSTADNALYKFQTCSDRGACSGCSVPGVGNVADGARAPFFKKAVVACDQSCLTADNQVFLTCADGQFANRALYADYKFGACRSDCAGTMEGELHQGRIVGLGGGAPNSVCGLPWKTGVVTHDTEIIAYARTTVACGDKCSNHKATIKCNGYRGLWSGGGVYIYPTCVDPVCP